MRVIKKKKVLDLPGAVDFQNLVKLSPVEFRFVCFGEFERQGFKRSRSQGVQGAGCGVYGLEHRVYGARSLGFDVHKVLAHG